jgi:hypothetical protein
MSVRIASVNGYEKKHKKFCFEDMVYNLENTTKSYNEIVGSVNKLFFDIDDAINETNFR